MALGINIIRFYAVLITFLALGVDYYIIKTNENGPYGQKCSQNCKKTNKRQQCGKVLYRTASSAEKYFSALLALFRFYAILSVFMTLEVGFAQKIVLRCTFDALVMKSIVPDSCGSCRFRTRNKNED